MSHNEQDEKKAEEAMAFVRESADTQETMLRAYQRSAGPRGFWQIPWMPGAWTAARLVAEAEQKDGYTEYGRMSYVVGELFLVLDGSIFGEYYPYKNRGLHDHEHDFLTVLMQAILTGQVEPEKTEEYYAPWMTALLERVRTEPRLRRKARRWAKDPWKCAEKAACGEDIAQALRRVCPELALPDYALIVDGARTRVSEIEEVYRLAVCFPDAMHYRIVDYSKQQIENIEAIRAYQRDALAHPGVVNTERRTQHASERKEHRDL